MAWVYLFIASLFEIAWTFCVKFLDFKKIASIKWSQFFTDKVSIWILMPLLGYIVFGLSNVFCFSLALKQIPASIALAVWMGITLAGVKLAEIYIFKEQYSWAQVFYMALILIGIIGLKRTR